MIKKVIYWCSYCEQVFEDKDACIKHEDGHEKLSKLQVGDLVFARVGLKGWMWVMVREVLGNDVYVFSQLNFNFHPLSRQTEFGKITTADFTPSHVIPCDAVLSLEKEVDDYIKRHESTGNWALLSDHCKVFYDPRCRGSRATLEVRVTPTYYPRTFRANKQYEGINDRVGQEEEED